MQISIPGSDELLVLDSGTGFRNLGNELENNDSAHRGRVFITHPHWDHLQGFPFFKPFYNGDNWFQIFMPPQGDMGCKEILQGHMSSTFFPVSIDMLKADLQFVTFELGRKDLDNFSVEYMWASHTVPTAMYKLTIGDQVIVFAPDNEIMTDESADAEEFQEEFRAFIHGANLLVHDAQFSREEYENRIGWGHSAWEDVVRIAGEEKVKHLCLTHHDPDNDDKMLAKLEHTIREKHGSEFDELFLAKEGQEIILPYNIAKKINAD